MPTALRVGPYRFFFYSNEFHEPPHIHVQRDQDVAKWWLEPVALADNQGFSAKELRSLHLIVTENTAYFTTSYREYHG
jgi:hypothetical protein